MHNIALIGMPGAGKSSTGKAFAQQTGARFIDTDRLIEQSQGASLQALLESRGHVELRRLEEQEILRLEIAPESRFVIATGGSAVYSAVAMQKLRELAEIVYLEIPLSTMLQRVRSAGEMQRGLARPESQSLEALYREREPLYRAAADRTIDCEELSLEQVVGKLAGTGCRS